MNNEKSDIVKIMSYLDGEDINLNNLSCNEELIEKMKCENQHIKNAFETIEEMEDMTFSILKKIRAEQKQDKNILQSLIPIFIVTLMFISAKNLLNINFEIGNFISLISILNNVNLIIKSLINANYFAFALIQFIIISIIIIFLVKKGCMKNEI